MRKKEAWMKLGAPVIAAGKPGRIAVREIKTYNEVQYLTKVKVKMDGAKFSTWYKPHDIVFRPEVGKSESPEKGTGVAA